jgi:hypothetical protein
VLGDVRPSTAYCEPSSSSGSDDVDVFEVFDTTESEDIAAQSRGSGRPRHPWRTAGVVGVITALAVGVLATAAFVTGRVLASGRQQCSQEQLQQQGVARDWLQGRLDGGLPTAQRRAAPFGCSPSDPRESPVGAWAPLVDVEEVNGLQAALAQGSCTLADPQAGDASCQTQIEGLEATVSLTRADPDSPFGDWVVRVTVP